MAAATAIASNGYRSFGYASDDGIPYDTGLGGRSGRTERNSNKVDHDKPPFSRLFVVCGKQHSAADLKQVFEEFGTVEDVWVVKDRNTKKNRGIAYIKYSKMSEACLAVENLHGTKVNDDDEGSLKVLIAQSKSSKSSADFKDETALTRIFVLIPKSFEENELNEAFQEFGDINEVQVVKNRKTGENKGFGYVRYTSSYAAAKALENCDKSYKAVMAEPKAPKVKKSSLSSASQVTANGSHVNLVPWQRGVGASSKMQLSGGFQDGIRCSTISNRLEVQYGSNVNFEQLCLLFDLIPGMESCSKQNFISGECYRTAIVVYKAVGSAIYAKEKLNGFEYPPGCKMTVCYASEAGMRAKSSDLSKFCSPVVGGGSSYCSVPLPPTEPLVDSDSIECMVRLFVVCHPSPPPPNVLLDVFSRFGDLLDVYMLRDKNYGYARYASAEAANRAMERLHGAEVFNRKLKVLPAEPPKTAKSTRKRPHT